MQQISDAHKKQTERMLIC